jgi:predicted ABC-type ATPase
MPELFIVGGPNGCGKTTVALQVLEATDLPFLSADSIAAELSPENPSSAAVAAGRLLSRRLAGALGKGESLILESTLSGLSLKKTIQQAREMGYRTEILFVFLDTPADCATRIKERVARGGHDVPALDIARRFPKNHCTTFGACTAKWFPNGFFTITAERRQAVSLPVAERTCLSLTKPD